MYRGTVHQVLHSLCGGFDFTGPMAQLRPNILRSNQNVQPFYIPQFHEGLY